jgi:hypothetical protein
MKAISKARWIARIGAVVCCLAITAIAGVEFRISKSLAGQMGQSATVQNEQVPVWYPNATVGDFLAAAIR